jgi:hypothetical protein
VDVKDLTKADLLELVSVTSQAPSPCLLPLLVLTGTGAWLGGASPATRHRQNPERMEGGAVQALVMSSPDFRGWRGDDWALGRQ